MYRAEPANPPVLQASVLLKLAAGQILLFDWIAGSCQVKLLKQSWVIRKPVNFNPGLKVNQIITVSSIEILFCSFCFVYRFNDY